MPPFDPYLLNIDIHSLIIFLNILLDSSVRLLDYFLSGAKKPSKRNFYRFKKDLDLYTGIHFDQFCEIVNKTAWHKELKDLRDDPIVHHPASYSGVNYGNEIGITLAHIHDRKLKQRVFTSKDVDFYCDSVFSFLLELNNFFVDIFDDLPLIISKK